MHISANVNSAPVGVNPAPLSVNRKKETFFTVNNLGHQPYGVGWKVEQVSIFEGLYQHPGKCPVIIGPAVSFGIAM